MRARIEPVVQMWHRPFDCVGCRHAERIEAFRPRAGGKRGFQRMRI
jgi:hypothetical protein